MVLRRNRRIVTHFHSLYLLRFSFDRNIDKYNLIILSFHSYHAKIGFVFSCNVLVVSFRKLHIRDGRRPCTYLVKFFIFLLFLTRRRDKDSRPSSPVQSDTEFEVQKITQESKAGDDDKTHGQSWRWGELPSPPHDASLDAHGMQLNTADASSPSSESKYL